MSNDYIAKLKQLSPAVQAKLSDDKLLVRLDDLDAQYGVKAVTILLGLLLKDIDYAGLADKLKADYGFNDFLATEIKGKFGDLIKIIGEASASSRPVPADSTIPTAPLTFSRTDEDEVKKYITAVPAAKIDYADAARKIISAFGYRNPDEVMAKRLENIVAARIRDIRDNLETKENLMKSKKVGGLEFSDGDADKLLGLINNKPVLNARDPSTRPLGLGRDDNYGDRVSNINQPTIEMEDGLPVVRMPADRIDSPWPKKIISETDIYQPEKLPQPADDVKIETATEEILPAATPRPFIAEKTIPESVLNAKTALRPNLDDVKLEKKLMGPIEELETMTIIDFRRLAADPQTAVNKIKEKIDLLEGESFNQKIAGIAGWQKSEVSRFYRLLGQLSMSENKNIETVIKERLMSGKPTLSLDEFHAVMELNRALRY